MSLSLEVLFFKSKESLLERRPNVIYKGTTIIKEQVIKDIQMTNKEKRLSL